MSKPSADRLKILIAGGSGLIGQHLVQHWSKTADITILGRDRVRLQRLYPTLNHLDWQHITAAHIASQHVVINLCGAHIAAWPWTQARYQLLLDSRVEPTQRLVQLCQAATTAPAWFIQASGTGIYGCYADTHAPWVETDTASTDHQLPRLAQAWEQASDGLPASTKRLLLRFGVVLTPRGGALASLVWPYRLRLGGVLGSGQQGFAWIAGDDIGSAIDHLLQHQLHGPVNLVAPELISQRALAQAIAASHQQTLRWHWPTWLLRPMGRLVEELVLLGQYVQPQVLQHSGYVFKHPQLQPWLQHCHNMGRR